MGFLSSLFGSSKSQPQTTVVQQTQKLPEEIAPKVAEIADEAKRLYDERVAEGYVPYEGATIAPFTQQELDAQAGIEGLVGLSAPIQQEALGITRQQGEQFTGDIAQQYMNPYQQAVIDIEKRKAQEDFETRILPQFEKQAVSAGGMSGLGSRAGVQAALLGEAQGQRLGDIQSKGLQQAFLQGRQEFNAQKARERGQAQDLAKAGPAMFASGVAEQGALTGVGEQRRGLAQEALDEAYFRFLEERGEPQAALAEYSGTVYANPLNTIPSLNKQSTVPGQQGPSTGSQLLGLGLQAASMYYGGGFGGMGAGMTRAEGGRLNDGLSGMVYRQASGQIIGEEEKRITQDRNSENMSLALAQLAADLRATDKTDPNYSGNIARAENILKNKSPQRIRPSEYATKSYNIPDTLSDSARRAGVLGLIDQSSSIKNLVPTTATLPAVSIDDSVDGGPGQGSDIITKPATPPPPPPNEEAYDVGKDILRRLAGMDKRVASEVAAARAEDLTYRTERNQLMADQRTAESDAFNTLSDSQTKRLADEMLRRREEITGRDGNITLSKAFGVAAKSFSDPNLSIVQQISGAMGGMTETVVAERLLQREQLSELDKEEFDKETVIIDRKLARNLETMQKNNAQDLSILNLDRAGQKELAALPAKARSEYLSNAKDLASIIDDLRVDASSSKQFNPTTALENGRKRVMSLYDATLDKNGDFIGRNGNPLSRSTRLAIDASYQTYVENFNSIYMGSPTAVGASAAAQYAGSQLNTDSTTPAPTVAPPPALITQLKTAPAGQERDRAIAIARKKGYNVTPESLN